MYDCKINMIMFEMCDVDDIAGSMAEKVNSFAEA